MPGSNSARITHNFYLVTDGVFNLIRFLDQHKVHLLAPATCSPRPPKLPPKPPSKSQPNPRAQHIQNPTKNPHLKVCTAHRHSRAPTKRPRELAETIEQGRQAHYTRVAASRSFPKTRMLLHKFG